MVLPLLAEVQASALDKLKQIPPAFWLRVGIAIAVVVLVIFLLRKVAAMNKFILFIVVALAMVIIGFNWIYQRTEPAWATPVVEKLATFLPSKGPPPRKP